MKAAVNPNPSTTHPLHGVEGVKCYLTLKSEGEICETMPPTTLILSQKGHHLFNLSFIVSQAKRY